MRVASVHFERPVPVLGTSLRQDHFDASEGWSIDVYGAQGVELHRPGKPEQNIREVPAFCVAGVGFCAPVEVHVTEQKDVPGDVPGVAVPEAGGNPEPRGAAADSQQAESRKTRAKRLK